MYEDEMYATTGILALFAVVGLFILVIALLTYVLFALGLAKIMKAKGMEDRYRAWIPFWNSYVLGSIVEEEIGNEAYVFDGTKWIFTFGGLAAGVIANIIPFIGALVPLALYVYIILCCAVMAKKYDSMVAVIVTSILCLPGIGYLIMAGKMENNCEAFGKGYTGGDSQATQNQNTDNYNANSYSNTSFASGANSETEEPKTVEFETVKTEEVQSQETVPLSYNVGGTTDDKEEK